MTKKEIQKIDDFADALYAAGDKECKYTLSLIDPFKSHIYPYQVCGIDRYIKFEAKDLDAFYGYWQPCARPAPLLIHTPGYGGAMSMHPELSEQFNVLHITPLGVVTPDGFDRSKMTHNGLSSVLPDTISTGGKGGYFDWLSCVSIAVKWAWTQNNVIPNRVSFFGTSQGGGASLLLGSIYSGRGTACVVADQPFLTNFKLGNGRGAYESIIAKEKLFPHLSDSQIFETLFCYDTMHHVHRLDKIPVLLTAGGKDTVCPPDTIESLYNSLSGTKSYTFFEGLSHGCSRKSLTLARAWFLLHA